MSGVTMREAMAEDLVRQFMAVMDEARDAARRSVLDGTISCQICRALVLESNADGHQAWHATFLPRLR